MIKTLICRRHRDHPNWNVPRFSPLIIFIVIEHLLALGALGALWELSGSSSQLQVSTPQISFSKYVNIDLGTTSPVKKSKGCSCKKGCNKACGCKKKGLRCHSGCACNGNCHWTIKIIWIITVEDNRIECICHLNKTRVIKYKEYVIKCWKGALSRLPNFDSIWW